MLTLTSFFKTRFLFFIFPTLVFSLSFCLAPPPLQAEAVGGGHQTARYASTVVRFELPAAGAFNASAVTTLDLAAVDPDLRGFSDGVVSGGARVVFVRGGGGPWYEDPTRVVFYVFSTLLAGRGPERAPGCACTWSVQVAGQHMYLVPYRNRDSLQPVDLYGYFGKVRGRPFFWLDSRGALSRTKTRQRTCTLVACNAVCRAARVFSQEFQTAAALLPITLLFARRWCGSTWKRSGPNKGTAPCARST